VNTFNEIQGALEDELKSLKTRRDAVQEALTVYGGSASKAAPGAKLPLVDMARTVVRNAGRPLSIEKIIEGIRKTYGIEPPDTLAPVLTRRAAEKEGFFLTDREEIGVLATNSRIQTAEAIRSSNWPRKLEPDSGIMK